MTQRSDIKPGDILPIAKIDTTSASKHQVPRYFADGKIVRDIWTRVILTCENEDDAAFVVKNFNAHENTAFVLDCALKQNNTLSERNSALVEALKKCRDQFRFYADSHREQGKLDKAQTNANYESICVNALTSRNGE